MKHYFVTAIGTGCGKTIISALLCEALKADYWKPVQSGTEEIDALVVRNLLFNSISTIHSEQIKLKMPASPNIAADAEGKTLHLNDFILPYTQNTIVIEGAGGILVPLNNSGDFVIDFAARFNCEIILVVNLYLGCINHTLLTVNELKNRNLPIAGIIFNGEGNEAMENTILSYAGLPCLYKLPKQTKLDKGIILNHASLFLRSNLHLLN